MEGKNIFKWYQQTLLVIFSLFILCAGKAYSAEPVIGWSSGYPVADPVNVGSGKPGFIYFRFEVQDAAIPGAKIIVQFPSATADSYDPAVPATNAGGGAFIDFPNAIWNSTDRTLTFSGVDLAVGNNVSYQIPHKATDALATSITSGTVSVTVLKADNTPIDSKTSTYNYNRAQLPIVAASGMANLSQNFGTNTWSYQGNSYTDQTYKFGLSTAGGSVDSCRVKVVFPKEAATVTSGTWTCNGLPVNRVTETFDATNATYIVYLDKSFSQGADGFDAGEKVDITFNVKKKYCGNTNVTLSAAWGSSGDYVASASNTGTFASTPSGDPNLVRVSLGPVNPGLRNVDGVTPNPFQTKIKNIGTGDASDIVYTLTTTTTPYISFLSTEQVKYSLNGGITWKTISIANSESSRGAGSGVYSINPSYSAKPTKITIEIPENLPAGDSLIIEWNSYSAADMFNNYTTVADRTWTRSTRHDDSWTYRDLCRSSSFNIQSASVYSMYDYMSGTNLGATVSLNAGTPVQTAKISSILFDCYRHSGILFKPGTSGAYVQMRILLPDGIKINESSPGVYGVKLADSDGTSNTWAYSNPTKTVVSDGTLYTFDYKTQSIATKYLFVSFESDCPANSGLYNADISFDFLPTGNESGTGANVRISKALRFFSPISLSCNATGLTYSFEMERKNFGFTDSDNNGLADAGTPVKIDPSYAHYADIDQKQVVINDTAILHFKGKVLGTGMKYLYAVMISEKNQTWYGALADQVLTSGDNPYTLQLINPTVVNNIVSAVGGGNIAATNYACMWQIQRQDGQNFDNNELVNLAVPVKALANAASYQPTTVKLGSWFYASSSSLPTPYAVLNPGVKRKGDEEYAFGTTYFGGGIGSWAGAPTSLNFNGAQEKQANNYYSPSYSLYTGWSPYEFRSIGNVDTVYVNVPDGYLINDQMAFTISGGTGSLVATADPLNSSKTRKAFPIKDFYDTNPVTMYSQNTSGKIRMSDGAFAITCYPKIKSTPRTPVGTKAMTMSIVCDNKTYSQTLLPNVDRTNSYASTSLVYADGPGIFISTPEATSKNLSSANMSWSFKIANTQATPASQVWLYVQGPVENVSFNGIQGTGEGGRWIKLPAAIPANGSIQSALSFEVKSNSGCSNQTVTVYPIYNPTAPANWNPFGGQTDANFNPNNPDFDNYVYREVVLKLTPVESQISGGFTSWTNSLSNPSNLSSPVYGIDSVEVTKPFTVEVIFDASGSAAPVAQLEATVNFPKGLEYVPNSAYIEYKTINTQITDTDWINQLATLTNADSGSPKSLTFKLADIVDQSAIFSMFGSNAALDGGKKAIFRFQLKPTCSINMQAEEITAQLSGKRYCDLTSDVTGSNIQIYPSSKLTLKNALLPFRSTLVLNPSLVELVCEPGRDTAIVTLNFTKLTKLAEDMSPTDSIRISIPASLNVTDGISYSFPAYTGHGLNLAAESGTIPSGNMKTYINGNLRYFSWALPAAYYTPLAQKAASDEVTLTYSFKVKAGSHNIRQTDTSRIYVSTISEMAPHATCPKYVAQADSTFNKTILVPSKNAYLTNLYVNGNVVNDFNPNVFEYTIILPCGTELINISGTPYSECASVRNIYQGTLERYFKRFEVVVTAEDGIHEQTYVVNARPLMPAKIVKDLPQPMVACQSIDYKMHATFDGDSLTYQWFNNNYKVTANNKDTLLIVNPDKNKDYGKYRVIAHGACQSTDSSSWSRFWAADKLTQPIEIMDVPATVYANQMYKMHVGTELGFDDATNYTWNFSLDENLYFSLTEPRTRHTVFATFGHTPGVGELKVSIEHPCSAYFGPYEGRKTITLIDNTTSIDNVDVQMVSVYPNPFDSELHIKSEFLLESIIVSDISGRRIAVYNNTQSKELTVPASSWEKGTYLISIKTEKGTTVQKVMKK